MNSFAVCLYSVDVCTRSCVLLLHCDSAHKLCRVIPCAMLLTDVRSLSTCLDVLYMWTESHSVAADDFWCDLNFVYQYDKHTHLLTMSRRGLVC